MTTQENAIRRGECCLGIELGSTRIKAVAIRNERSTGKT